jgi:hypothetical protein
MGRPELIGLGRRAIDRPMTPSVAPLKRHVCRFSHLVDVGQLHALSRWNTPPVDRYESRARTSSTKAFLPR